MMPVLKTFEVIGRSPKSWEDAVQEVLRRAYKTIVGLREVEVLGWSATVKPEGGLDFEARVLVSFEVVEEYEPHA